jgi:hypothetical protein
MARYDWTRDRFREQTPCVAPSCRAAKAPIPAFRKDVPVLREVLQAGGLFRIDGNIRFREVLPHLRNPAGGLHFRHGRAFHQVPAQLVQYLFSPVRPVKTERPGVRQRVLERRREEDASIRNDA